MCSTNSPASEAASLTTPVALFVFNRPDPTARVFAAIADARPSRLLVIADGPRHERAAEALLCERVREIVSKVNWDCEVSTNFSDINLGCRRRVSSGLDWVFSQVEAAIILEDDCVPDASFFRYCSELLDRYRDDPRVALISGDNFQPARRAEPYSYYFSRYVHVWGWASWRRTWNHYDVGMSAWPAAREAGLLRRYFSRDRDVRYWTAIFDAVHAGAIDTWDYQLLFSCWSRHALTALPDINLISNIGHGADATHTVDSSPFAALAAHSMAFPLHHPPDVVPDTQADAYSQRHLFTPASLWRVAGAKVRGVLRRLGTIAGFAKA